MGLKGAHSVFFYFFLGVLSLVLPSCIIYSCPPRLYPFHCPFCGPVISSPLNLTAVSSLTAFMSVMCYFILNLKLFLDLVLELRLSSVLKSLRILTWLLPSITAVPMWHLQETWMNLGNQIATKELTPLLLNVMFLLVAFSCFFLYEIQHIFHS